MIWTLRFVFIGVLATMLAVTSYASLQCNILQIPAPVLQHPWFIATMFDTYFGFLTFYLWVCYKETSLLSRIAWFVLIMILGNIAMATYMLLKLFKLPTDSKFEAVLLR